MGESLSQPLKNIGRNGFTEPSSDLFRAGGTYASPALGVTNVPSCRFAESREQGLLALCPFFLSSEGDKKPFTFGSKLLVRDIQQSAPIVFHIFQICLKLCIFSEIGL